MLRLILSRLISAVPLLLIISLAAFALFQLSPVDPTVGILGQGASVEAREQLRAQLRLDRPLVQQFVEWVLHALQGNFGSSYFSGRSVTDVLLERLPVTLSIAFGGVVLAVLVGVPLGVAAARRPNSVVDRVITAIATTALSVPAFWLALLLVLFFAVELSWFPVVGFTPFSDNPAEWARSLTLPWVAVGVPAMASIARQTRSSMIETLRSPFVRSLEFRGIPTGRIITAYALKNSLIPVVAAVVLQAQLAIGAGFIVETVFAIPGLGQQLLDSVVTGDLPVLQGAIVVVAIVVVILNLIGDALYGALDPKVRPS